MVERCVWAAEAGSSSLPAPTPQPVRAGIRFPGMAQVRLREDPADTGRPEPDAAPAPDLTLRDLPFREWRGIFVRAAKRFLDDNGTMLASALAYSTFFAIPSVLLVVVGVFTLVVGPGAITTLMALFPNFMPAQATSLLGGSLHRLDQHPSTGLAITIVGFRLGPWCAEGGVTGVHTG